MKTYTFSGHYLGLLTLSFLSILLLFSMPNVNAQQQVVLPADGSFSQENSPQGGLHVQRQLYLITPDEMAASGLSSGVDINSIGFTIAAAQDTTTIGAFKLYLQNTTDNESRTDTMWSTTTSSTNSVVLTGIPAGDYEWQVQAACSGNSAFSNSRDFSNVDISGCNHPINLTVSAITDISATLNWYAPLSPNFVEYKVEYTPVNTNNWTSAVTTSTSLNISGLSPSTNYQWRVRTICASDSSEINNSQFATLNENNCNAPSVLEASNPTGTTMDLTWIAASGADRYDIQFRRVGTSQWLSTLSFSNAFTLNFGLVAGTSYEWKVRTVCTAGKGAFISGPDFTTLGTTVCYVPTNLYTDNISETTATFHWTESVSATSYNIRYRLKNAISWANAIAPMDTVHNDSILIPSETGPFSVPFSMGSPFVYTGGGIYIAFEYENDTAQLSTLNNALATKQNTSILNQYGSDSILIVLCLDGKTNPSDLVLPDILTSTKLRPQTSFGSSTFVDSVAIEAVYALGQYALGYSDGAVVSALVTNEATEERTYQVNFDVEDNNGTTVYNATQAATIPADTSVLVSFSSYTPSMEGEYSLIISADPAPTENVLSNNSATYTQTVTASTIAYDDGSSQITNAGFGVDSGLILTKNQINGCGRVNAASVFLDFSSIGHDIYAVILDSSGEILDSSTIFTPTQDETGKYHSFYFPKTPFFNNDEFYIGIAQQSSTGDPYYPVGVQWETSHVRDDAYFRDSIAGMQLIDMPDPGRLMIRAEIISGSLIPVIEGDLALCSGETDTLTVASATQRFANEIKGYSSQTSSQNYSADQALGAPDVYPEYEANSSAWMSNTADDQREFIELGYSNATPINYIDIYETFNPGAVDSVYVKNPGTGIFEIVYSSAAVAQGNEARINRILFPITPFNVSEIRIALASDAVSGYNAIDAVAIGELSSPGSFATYLWSPNGESTNEVYVTNPGIYSVVVSDGSGCEGSASVEVVSPQQTVPVISVAPGGSTEFCLGESVTLISDQTSGNLWSTGETTQSITVGTAGSYTVSYDDGTGCGLATSDPINVVVNSLPDPTISGSLGICPSGSTTLDAGAGYSDYYWSTGEVTQAISVTQASTYIVTVTDGNGCSGSANATTFISTPPSPSISGILSFCPGGSTTLNAGAGYSHYSWSTGENTQTISVTTATTISVVVTDGNGCTGSTSATTSIFTPPSPSISGDLDFCLGESTLLDAGSGYSNYSWSNGGTSQTNLISSPGTYGVTVTDGNGCTGSVSVAVSVNIPPTPVITGSFSFCGGSSTTLDAGPGYNSYSWSTGEISQQITVLDTITYSVTVTDANGCTGTASATTSIEGEIPVSPGPISGPTEGLCNAVNIEYSIDPVPNASFYVWTVPDSVTILSGQGTTSILANIGNGFSSGEIVVAASNACGQSPSIDPTFITISTIPDPTGPITGPASGLCNQSSVQFSVEPVSGASFYNWTVPAGSFITSGQGSNTIQVTLGNNSGDICVQVENACGNSAITCLPISTSGFSVNAGDCKQVVPGVPPLDCVDLVATLGGGTAPFTFTWYEGVNVLGSSQTITVCPTVNTTYMVVVVDASGCTATASVDVITTNALCRKKNVQVCHVATNKTRCLKPSQVPGHLAHGDYIGSCKDPDPCGGSSMLVDDTDVVEDQSFNITPFTFENEGDASDEILVIYPNPARDYIYLDLRMFKEETIVIDILHPVMGLMQTLHIESKGSEKTEINLDMLSPGMYIISKRNDDGSRLSTKLIIAN